MIARSIDAKTERLKVVALAQLAASEFGSYELARHVCKRLVRLEDGGKVVRLIQEPRR